MAVQLGNVSKVPMEKLLLMSLMKSSTFYNQTVSPKSILTLNCFILIMEYQI